MSKVIKLIPQESREEETDKEVKTINLKKASMDKMVNDLANLTKKDE